MPSIKAEYWKRDRSPRTLRRFGFCLAATMFFAALLIGWRNPTAGYTLAGLGVGIAVGAEFKPKSLRLLHRVGVSLALLFRRVVPPILLTLIFFLLVTPLGLLQRLFRVPGVDTRFKIRRGSHWETREGGDVRAGYEKQF